MKKHRILSMLLLIVALAAIAGSVGAYMRKQTSTMENIFVPAQVSCEVVETFKGNMKSDIAVKNTSTIDAYLRLRMVSYWIDENGDILAKTSPKVVVPLNTDNWFVIDNIYYYKKTVEPGACTTDLLLDGQSILLTIDDEDGSRQVIEVFAEAIQSLPEDAVTGAWNGVAVDSDGNLSKNN